MNPQQGQQKTWFQIHLLSLSLAQPFPTTGFSFTKLTSSLQANSRDDCQAFCFLLHKHNEQMPPCLSYLSCFTPARFLYAPMSHSKSQQDYRPRLEGERAPKHSYPTLLPQILKEQLLLKACSNLTFYLSQIIVPFLGRKNSVWLKQRVNCTGPNPNHINLHCFGCFVYWEDQNISVLGAERLPHPSQHIQFAKQLWLLLCTYIL